MYTEQITQRLGLSNGVPPQVLNSGATARASTPGIDMSKFHRCFFIVQIGAVTSGAISAWLQESSDNFNTDVPSNNTASSFSNSNGANLSSLANTTSNEIITFEVRADQLTPGKRYVRLQVAEVNGTNTTVAVVGYGDESNHKPGNASNGNLVLIQNVPGNA